MEFAVVERGQVSPGGLARPYAVLRRNGWDDFGFKTLFEVTLVTLAKTIQLGSVKILNAEQGAGYTPIDDRFVELGDGFCSVGQDPEYYDLLGNNVEDDVRYAYLEGLCDVAYDPEIEAAFTPHPGWSTSLFRFGQATAALDAGKQLLRGGSNAKKKGVLQFSFAWARGDTETDVNFAFDDSDHLPGRLNALIGYNGVGKTTLLADLAVAASRVGLEKSQLDKRLISGSETSFGSVIAVSYSAFDTFQTPSARDGAKRNERFGYVYCGLRKFTTEEKGQNGSSNSVILKRIDEIETEFAEALATAGDRNEHQSVFRALEQLSKEPSFGRVGVDLNELATYSGSENLLTDFAQLSTGHKIVLNIVVQLAAHLRQRSLVLIDEPETHLHPPLMAALLRAVQSLLSDYDSFAIVATHSPVVVQEIPSHYIRILERVENDVILRRPNIETFGESIGSITRHVFSLDSSATDFQGVLAELSEVLSLDQIEELFDRGLSSQARSFVLNYRNQRI